MSEDNKSLILELTEALWNRKDLSAVDRYLAEDYVQSDPPLGFTPDREGFRRWVGVVTAAFPDLDWKTETIMAEGDKVATRWTVRGTHRREFFGVPATNKEMEITGLSVDLLEAGKVKQSWVQWDQLSLLQQLGLIPEPGS
jgi:steroid delta-isomerase-like uncharacterized protein